MLQRRGAIFDNRDARFLPFISPLGGGRDMMNPLARTGRGVPFDLMRGGGYPGGLWGGRGALGQDLFSSPLYGNRPGLGRGLGLPVDFRDQLVGYPLQGGRYPQDIDLRLGINDLRRMPYDFHRDDWWPHGPDCETCWRERRYHEDQGHYGRCGCRRSCENSNSNYRKDFKFKTKDVTIRGKARAVRASYLAEASKFEVDLVKYMEKKKEEDVPDRVIDMLISFINREEYTNENLLDEVTLNIVASNVGAKSAADYSLGRLKKVDCDIPAIDLCHVIKLITQSSRVDDGLKKWLVKYLKADNRDWRLAGSSAYRQLEVDRPEVVAELERMMGVRGDVDDGFREV